MQENVAFTRAEIAFHVALENGQPGEALRLLVEEGVDATCLFPSRSEEDVDYLPAVVQIAEGWDTAMEKDYYKAMKDYRALFDHFQATRTRLVFDEERFPEGGPADARATAMTQTVWFAQKCESYEFFRTEEERFRFLASVGYTSAIIEQGGKYLEASSAAQARLPRIADGLRELERLSTSKDVAENISTRNASRRPQL